MSCFPRKRATIFVHRRATIAANANSLARDVILFASFFLTYRTSVDCVRVQQPRVDRINLHVNSLIKHWLIEKQKRLAKNYLSTWRRLHTINGCVLSSSFYNLKRGFSHTIFSLFTSRYFVPHIYRKELYNYVYISYTSLFAVEENSKQKSSLFCKKQNPKLIRSIQAVSFFLDKSKLCYFK